MNILDELNAGKKLRRKGWLQHKGQETLYISKLITDRSDIVALWTNNETYSNRDAIAFEDGFWAVEFITMAREIFSNDWEVVE